MNVLVTAIRAVIVTAVLTGIAYPLVLLGVAKAVFPGQAEGSLVRDEQGEVIGSELIGQGFALPHYFHPRPSAAGEKGYDATASGGSNLGPTSVSLNARVKAAVEQLRAENPDAKLPIPADLVTASASGLDPDISPAGARWQAARVAKARGVTVSRVETIVESLVERRTLGFLGEPRVNVLRLNLALDRELGRVRPGQRSR